MSAPLVEVSDLRVSFRTPDGVVDAVKGVSFTIERGEILALVGESGSGKSVTALSIPQLLPPSAFHPAGSIRFDGTGMLGASEAVLRSLRGARVSMVFQEPMTSLNPVFSVDGGVPMVTAILEKRGPRRLAIATNDCVARFAIIGQKGMKSRRKATAIRYSIALAEAIVNRS